MSVRDVHNRCVTCGRPPSKECCEKCHRVAETLGRIPLYGFGQMHHTSQDAFLDDLTQPTEAVNQ